MEILSSILHAVLNAIFQLFLGGKKQVTTQDKYRKPGVSVNLMLKIVIIREAVKGTN